MKSIDAEIDASIRARVLVEEERELITAQAGQLVEHSRQRRFLGRVVDADATNKSVPGSWGRRFPR